MGIQEYELEATENWNIGRFPEKGEFFLPPDARSGLDAVFGEGVTNDVRTIHKPWFARLHLMFIGAWEGSVTRPGRIFTTLTPDQFANADFHVLHEHFHVVRQWGTGMTIGSYLLNSSSVESAANSFAARNLATYQRARAAF